jgi:hypothetical protein
MHGESLPFVAWLNICRSLDWLAQTPHRLREIVRAAARKGVLARLTAGRLHGAADACHGHRAAVHGRSRQPGIAKNEFHPLDRQAGFSDL